MASVIGCGNTYRPVVSAINPVGPAAQPQKFAVAISTTGATAPGLVTFVDFSGDTVLKPTLSWLLQTNDPGKFDAEISYVASGMSWQADYNLVVSDNPKSKTDLLDMVGWITMRNQSGKTFENANIKLMAGDVNKIQPGTLANRAYAAAKMVSADEAMAPTVRGSSPEITFTVTPCPWK